MIGAQIFSREGVEKDERAKQIQSAQVARILKDQDEEMRTIIASAERKLVSDNAIEFLEVQSDKNS